MRPSPVDPTPLPSGIDLAKVTPTQLADAVRDLSLIPARERQPGSDPLLAALTRETDQFMLGACALLAAHLNESRGWPAVILEGHRPGQGWRLSHASVTPLPAEEAEKAILAGHGFELPLLDAAGGGCMADRMALYREEGWDYRVILAIDPDCSVEWLWRPNPARPKVDMEADLVGLPALSHALGLPFEPIDVASFALSQEPGNQDIVEALGALQALGSPAP